MSATQMPERWRPPSSHKRLSAGGPLSRLRERVGERVFELPRPAHFNTPFPNHCPQILIVTR